MLRHAGFLAFMAMSSLANARDVNCACGYLDPVTKDLWTDSTIIYFNESSATDIANSVDLTPLEFENKYETGYDVIYRQGASLANLQFNDSGVLQIELDPPTKNHLVMGGGMRTTRQDIKYGSFRASLQPPQTNMGGGSALSMYYRFNDSQQLELDLFNTDLAETANVNYKVNLPSSSAGPKATNFTVLVNGTDKDAWSINEFRFDWTKEMVKFTTPGINTTEQWNITKKEHGLPTVPGSFFLKHWATGGKAESQGPPTKNPVGAWVGYVRIFYNSSITSTDETFGAQCRILQAQTCSTDDLTLRTSSTYPAESALRWKQIKKKYKAPRWAKWGFIVSGALFLTLVLHAVIRRLYRHFSVPKADRPVHPPAYAYKLDRFALHGELTPAMIKEKKKSEKAEKEAIKRGETPIIRAREIDADAASLLSTDNGVGGSSGPSGRGFSSLRTNPRLNILSRNIPAMYYVRPDSGSGGNATPQNGLLMHEVDSDGEDQMASDEEADSEDQEEAALEFDNDGTPRPGTGYAGLRTRPDNDGDADVAPVSRLAFEQVTANEPASRKKSIAQAIQIRANGGKFWRRFFSGSNSRLEEEKNEVIQISSRVLYLDGLRGFCCLMVSLVHYSLTFYETFIDPTASYHYSWENWIRKIISDFFFNANFGIGVFFILSARLVGVGYLRRAQLSDLASSTFRRIPRLAFPVLCAVVLEYFLMGVGATKWLDKLSSISWGTWAYAVTYKNPGWFINEFLALLFVQPPHLPRIIYNYCTGVLWTIPVNIQYSWLIFLGVIVVREIKTPWKRFGYYAFCLVNSWYALNWGSYFWVGLAISDLDVTFHYRKWFSRRWSNWLAVIALWLIIAASMSTQYLQQFLHNFSFPTWENAVHPDLLTGRPIGQTPRYGYPEFNLPQVYSLFAASALLVLCDLSYMMQVIFNFYPLRVLGYYSYSIYLLHGAVFWTWGSWMTVLLSTKGLPYWGNQLIVFFSSYIILFISAYLWTPFADVFAQKMSTAVWRYAQGRSFYNTIG